MDETKTAGATAAAGGKRENQVQQVLNILETIKKVSKELRSKSSSDSVDCNSHIKTLMELQTQSESIFSVDPHLSSVHQRLSDLNELIQDVLDSEPGGGIRWFVTRLVRFHELSRVSSLIESELQAWVDRETILNLTKTLYQIHYSKASSDEEILLQKMDSFREILSKGFDINLQELLLKSGIFSNLERILRNPLFSTRVRERSAIAIKELVLYNKDVFVVLVLIGQTMKSLLSMASISSLQVLCSLIKAIKSPFVDELESSGGISKIVDLLHYSEDSEIGLMAFNCVLEIGYFGRKESVQAMLNAGLIEKLVELQRLGSNQFTGCVVKFTIQLEIGEGLRQREKRSFKQEILETLKKGCVSEAEAATIAAEVLWGASP
ncbi:Armadillo-like helical [Olea europaea subsp. europaea]|uniref:Armadillo-like helical n=1 Tax=Olea europaea subsp. europaea TaxID=158383 RepID=A0A8S0T8T7_OLEEU|nr:Armadillo-like helical [Olea europaea subsp. europaea]